jgi:hypothetical protein
LMNIFPFKDSIISPITCTPLSILVGQQITCSYKYFAQVQFNIFYEVKALNMSYSFLTTGI